MTIKHLVICGGGPSVFRTVGALYHLEDHHFWDIANIQTIYGSSAGALFGAMLCLKFDHDTITSYLINRPWHEAYPIKISQIMEIYTKKGLYDHKFAEIIFKPLLRAKNLPLTITLKELFEYSNIELHIFSLELNQFKTVDLSYKTHPDLPLLDSLAMSCAIPMLFAPVCKNNECYVDGGIIMNYPVNNCINNGNALDEILGARFNLVPVDPCIKSAPNNGAIINEPEHKDTKGLMSEKKEENTHFLEENEVVPPINKSIITHNSTILDFLMSVFGKLIRQAGTELTQQKLPYELACDTVFPDFNTFKQSVYSQTYRKDMVDCGIENAKQFLEKHRKDLDLTKEATEPKEEIGDVVDIDAENTVVAIVAKGTDL